MSEPNKPDGEAAARRRERNRGRVYQQPYRGPNGERRYTTTWFIEYWVNGKRYNEAAHSTRRAVAVTLLNRRLGEKAAGTFVGPVADKTTFLDLKKILLDDYAVNGRRSIHTAEASMKNLEGFFGWDLAKQITSDRLNAYVRHRQEAGRKLATIQNELAALKRAFTLAERAGKVTRRPLFPTLSIRNTRSGFFERPAFETLRAALPEYLQPVVTFSYLTGWRISEVLGLEWRNIDFAAGIIRLEPQTTKNDDGRTFPFAVLPELEAVLRSQRAATSALERGQGRIIARVFHRHGVPIQGLRKAWATACLTAGLFRVVSATRGERVVARKVPTMVPHDFRRTAVRNLERAGVSRSVAMKLTGHLTESVYRRYAIVSESDLAEGVKKLAALPREKAARGRVVVLMPKA